LIFSASAIAAAQVPAALATHDVVVHSHHLVFHVLPGRLRALVLDAGEGTDSGY
jgi:hypothetical protein